jgi:hypothetical protein
VEILQEKREIAMGRPAKSIMYPYEVSVRFDANSLDALDRVAMFEREKRATMARRIIVEKLQVYERNPAFKRFLKQLEQNRVRDGKARA